VAFFALTAVGMVAAVVWALLGSRFLVVRSIQVTGNHLVPKSEVLAEAQIPMGLPLVRVSTSAVARRVESITQVQSARVTRDWPDRIVITVLERTPALAIRAGTGFDLVDASGVVVRQVTRKPAGMPLFTPAGAVLGNPGVRATVAVLADLPAAIARSVRSVTAPSAEAVTLHLARGTTVDWGNSSQSAQKAHELAILLHTHARYYDVSAPGSAVTG
jgi:cell division protein FtsQ